MTSGFPPDTAARRRAGVLVPLAGWLPFFAVLLGTVLLSVVRGVRAPDASDDGGRGLRCAPRRATVSHCPDGMLGGDSSWACRHPNKRPREPAVPTSDGTSSGLSPARGHSCPEPATTWAIASSVARSGS